MSKKPDNYLLKKTELGQVKKGFHELPSEAHTYGKAPQKDKEGARQVMASWDEGSKTGPKEGGRNYIAMNRQGVRNGCIDSKQLNDFRKHNEIKVKVKEGQKLYGVKIPSQDFTYGIANRPSTPIKNVITGSYAETHEEMRQQKEAVMKMLSNDKKKPGVQSSPKKQHLQEANRKKEIEAHNFKLSKFKNVPSKVKPLIQQNRA